MSALRLCRVPTPTPCLAALGFPPQIEPAKVPPPTKALDGDRFALAIHDMGDHKLIRVGGNLQRLLKELTDEEISLGLSTTDKTMIYVDPTITRADTCLDLLPAVEQRLLTG